MSEELELKFAIEDGEQVAEWLDRTFPAAAGARWRELVISDRYLDTAGGALAAAGHGARLRQREKRTMLTVKQDIEVRGALHRRIELESRATPSVRPADWPRSTARTRLESIVGGRRLIERFTIHQQRRERSLRLPGAMLLLSIDSGRVEVGGRPAGELRQLEVELREGAPEVLRRVGRRITRSGLAQPESRSKLVIAAALAEAAVLVRADDQLAEAGRKVLRRHLLRMLEREDAVRAGDELALKQMRVATRRQRATWRLLGDAFGRTVRRRRVAQLRRVARALGEMRDLDVLLGGLPADALLQPLDDAWRDRRAQAYDRLIELFDSARYGRFLDDYLELTGQRGVGVGRKLATAVVRDEAPPRIEAAYRRVLDAGGDIGDGDEGAAWHALRIAAKRLRYTIEAFGDPLDAGRLAQLIKPIVRLQDLLGGMNDARTAIGAVEGWLESAGTRASAAEQDAARAYMADQRRLITRSRRSFAAAWRGVAAKAYGRRLSAATRSL